MKKVIKETLNEKVFCELYETNKLYYVAVYFRYTKESGEACYEKYNDALATYYMIIN